MDYEVYVKIIIELKQLMNFNNEDFVVEHWVVGGNWNIEENKRLLWMIKNIFYKRASIAVTKDY